jgi:Txe/YoeB family toxin of Txe-Axe toxin-antitoxin module
MSKTPFEIRTELLELATEHAMAQFKANSDFAAQVMSKILEEAQVMPMAGFQSLDKLELAYKEMYSKLSANMPKMLSIAEIQENAKKMYDTFVSVKQ